jgi:hypothetical protein
MDTDDYREVLQRSRQYFEICKREREGEGYETLVIFDEFLVYILCVK